MESVLSRNPQLLQKEWGGRNDISKIPKGTIADYQEMLLKDHEPYKTLYGNNRHAEIDYWNKGNREMMRNMPGVAEVSNSDEVVEILKDNKRLEELKSQSKMRQEINYKGYKGQVDNTVNELYRIAKANNTRAMAKRIALLSGGIAASGYGINKLVSVGRRDNASA
jgi:hypothetical protein